MTRIERLTPDRFSAEQRKLYDAILAGRRAQSAAAGAPNGGAGAGHRTGASGARPGGGLTDASGALVGPFNPWLRSPEIGDRIQHLGEAIRFASSLPNNALEVAILVVAADWRAEFEWWAHARLARRAGVGAEVIAAIKDGRQPTFADAGEETAHRFAKELLERRRVSDETYRLARERFGENGVMDLVALLGYYTMVSMTLNVFEVPLPEGQLLAWGDTLETVI